MNSQYIVLILTIFIGTICGVYAWKKKLDKDMFEIEKKVEIEKQKITKEKEQDILKIAEIALEILKKNK